MEKALEFLKEILDMQDINYKVVNKVLDAIKELEEAQLNKREWYQKSYNEAMNKTCHGCYWWNDFYSKCDNHDNELAGVNGYGCNRYEAKAEQC